MEKPSLMVISVNFRRIIRLPEGQAGVQWTPIQESGAEGGRTGFSLSSFDFWRHKKIQKQTG